MHTYIHTYREREGGRGGEGEEGVYRDDADATLTAALAASLLLLLLRLLLLHWRQVPS